jgi:hypothetical protein
MNTFTGLSVSALVGLMLAQPVWATGDHDDDTEDGDHGAHVTRLVMPIMSSSRGMDLFVSKGCVACHAVNGIGGHDAASLDAHDMDEYMNPFDLAARMWAMAPYMIESQQEALGEQILFTGEELADIIAFLHDDRQQHEFTEAVLTPDAVRMMNHEHSAVSGPEEHHEEIGHGHTAESGHD